MSEVSEVLTQTLVNGVASNISDAIGLIVPVALGLFAVIFGVSMLPRLIKRFAR